jgi:hypothetical protein
VAQGPVAADGKPVLLGTYEIPGFQMRVACHTLMEVDARAEEAVVIATVLTEQEAVAAIGLAPTDA